jgi:hypothetical protein
MVGQHFQIFSLEASISRINEKKIKHNNEITRKENTSNLCLFLRQELYIKNGNLKYILVKNEKEVSGEYYSSTLSYSHRGTTKEILDPK